MAESGRLESGCSGNGTVGSNPTLSTTLRSSPYAEASGDKLNFGRHANFGWQATTEVSLELGVPTEALA